MRTAAAVLVAALSPPAAGHGSITHPPPRMGAGVLKTMKDAGRCFNSTCAWFSQGCQAGCDECHPNCNRGTKFLGECCPTIMTPTVTDPSMRTYQNVLFPATPTVPERLLDIFKPNPWRSPGFAPMYDPCGVLEGVPGDAAMTGDPTKGMRGTDLPMGVQTVWPAGSEQEVAWDIDANHGGGYSYRLCPKSENITEECFKRGQLRFVGDNSWIQFGDDLANRTAIPAARTAEGTNPPGSQWTKNPIPACSGMFGAGDGKPCEGVQFEPPLAEFIPPNTKYMPDIRGLFGFGEGHCLHNCDDEELAFWRARFNFNIIDRVQIPADLPPGDYLLGFRWDCEQTTQSWASCADIKITA